MASKEITSSAEVPMNNETQVLNALTVFVDLYSGDGDLVREGAKHHRVQVIEGGDVFGELSPGNYNFRIPREIDLETVRKLIKAKRVAWVCEDYRQSEEVVDALGLHPESGDDAVFGVAGGAAQPEQSRFDAMVDLSASLYIANPDMEQIFVVHDGVCGGANFYTNKGMERIVQEGGTEAEQAKMIEFRTKLVNALIERGVKPDKIKVGFAVVQDNKFVQLK
jgi:hypothetical protein